MERSVPTLVFDTSDEQVIKMVSVVDEYARMYAIETDNKSIEEWRETYDNKNRIAFLVSMETELFHKEIKNKLSEMRNNTRNKGRDNKILVVIVYDRTNRKMVDQLMKSIMKIRNGSESTGDSNGVETHRGKTAGSNGAKPKENKKSAKGLTTGSALAYEHTKCNIQITKVDRDEVRNIEAGLWSWFPHLLDLIAGTKNNDLTRKQVGVFYKIDSDSDVEFDWFSKQRDVLESHFDIKCECSVPQELEDEDLVQNSYCVVLYVSLNSLKRLNSFDRDEKSVIQAATDSSCKLIVFFEKIHESFHRTMVNRYEMHISGKCSFTYCVELLISLDLVKVRQRPEITFRGNHREEGAVDPNPGRPLFDINKARAALEDHPLHSPSIASSAQKLNTRPPSHGTNVKQATYKPAPNAQMEDVTIDLLRGNRRTERDSCWACLCPRNS